MADYISTLTGAAMDAALQDMAEHNSEAWAVGERNGVAVDSGDVTYHNNAQYYAQQAQSIAPASVTEAVRWDVAQTALTDANKLQARENINAADNDTSVQVVTQTFTSAQQEIARANIAAGGTNPNLLDNPFFQVNQRNFSSMASVANYVYTVDRWVVNRSDTTLNADGTMTVEPTANDYGIIQRIEKNRLIIGKTYTLSVIMNGEVYAVSFVWNNQAGYLPAFTGTIRSYLGPDGVNLNIWICARPGDSMTLQAVKLEEGTISTIANDSPPNYAEELAKCQRYFYRLTGSSASNPIGASFYNSASQIWVVVPLPVTLRATPTVTLSGTAAVLSTGGFWGNLTGITFNGMAGTALTLNGNASGTFSNTGQYRVYLSGTSSYLDFSADL